MGSEAAFSVKYPTLMRFDPKTGGQWSGSWTPANRAYEAEYRHGNGRRPYNDEYRRELEAQLDGRGSGGSHRGWAPAHRGWAPGRTTPRPHSAPRHRVREPRHESELATTPRGSSSAMSDGELTPRGALVRTPPASPRAYATSWDGRAYPGGAAATPTSPQLFLAPYQRTHDRIFGNRRSDRAYSGEPATGAVSVGNRGRPATPRLSRGWTGERTLGGTTTPIGADAGSTATLQLSISSHRSPSPRPTTTYVAGYPAQRFQHKLPSPREHAGSGGGGRTGAAEWIASPRTDAGETPSPRASPRASPHASPRASPHASPRASPRASPSSSASPSASRLHRHASKGTRMRNYTPSAEDLALRDACYPRAPNAAPLPVPHDLSHLPSGLLESGGGEDGGAHGMYDAEQPYPVKRDHTSERLYPPYETTHSRIFGRGTRQGGMRAAGDEEGGAGGAGAGSGRTFFHWGIRRAPGSETTGETTGSKEGMERRSPKEGGGSEGVPHVAARHEGHARMVEAAARRQVQPDQESNATMHRNRILRQLAERAHDEPAADALRSPPRSREASSLERAFDEAYRAEQDEVGMQGGAGAGARAGAGGVSASPDPDQQYPPGWGTRAAAKLAKDARLMMQGDAHFAAAAKLARGSTDAPRTAANARRNTSPRAQTSPRGNSMSPRTSSPRGTPTPHIRPPTAPSRRGPRDWAPTFALPTANSFRSLSSRGRPVCV